MDIKVGKQAIAEASKKLSNWGRWGKDDQIGTLNHVTPRGHRQGGEPDPHRQGVRARHSARPHGPQTGLFGGRFNPIHQMLATGTDAIAGQQDWNKIRYADDTLMLCVQGATHWDALGHIFYEDKAYNGHDAKLIDSRGLSACSASSIPRTRWSGAACCSTSRASAACSGCKDGESISNDELDKCAKDAERRDRPRRLRHRPHRPDGALPRREGMGRLCRRRRAGREVRELLLVPGEADRRDLHRHLGRRGAAERDHGGQPALALGGDPGHGPVHGRDFLSQGTGRGLRRRTASTSSSSAARR